VSARKKSGKMVTKNTPSADGRRGILAIIFPGDFLAATLYEMFSGRIITHHAKYTFGHFRTG